MNYLKSNYQCFIRNTSKGKILIAGRNFYKVNDNVVTIISLCDGTNTFSDIVNKIASVKNLNCDDIKCDINKIINRFKSDDVIKEISTCNYEKVIYTPDKPSSLTLELTYNCNEFCDHCVRSAGKGNPNEIKRIHIDKLLDELIELNISLLTLTGGEPLLRLKDVLYIAKKCTSNSIDVGLLTNGTLITPNIAKQLKDSGIKQIQISLEINETFHDNLRHRNGAYKEALRAIKYLNNVGIEVTAATVVTSKTYKKTPEIIKRAEKLNVRPRVAPIMPFGRGKNPDLLLSSEEYLDFHLITHKIEGTNELSATVLPRESCSVGSSPVITPNGDIYPCMHLVFNEFKIGNIKKDTLKYLWRNSDKLTNLRNISKNERDGCKDCWNKMFCNTCLGIAYIYHGTIKKPEPYRCRANRLFTIELLKRGDKHTKKDLCQIIDNPDINFDPINLPSNITLPERYNREDPRCIPNITTQH